MDGSRSWWFFETPVWHVDAARGPSTPSLDHLVGAGEQGGRHVEAERLRGFEVDHKLVLGRRLDRQISRIDVDGGASKQIHKVDAVRHQTPFFHGKTIGRNARYTVSRRQFDNAVAMNDIETVR